MNTVYYDPPFSDERRREELYQGQLIVYSPRKSSIAFVDFARELIKEAFKPYDLRPLSFIFPLSNMPIFSGS